MDKKLIARPTFNRKSGKWNLAIKTDDGEIKIGNENKDGITFNYKEFETKKDVIEYIDNNDRLILYNPLIDVLNKYSRN